MTGKQNVVYLHDGILFSHTGEKEFSTDTYHSTTNVETNMREAGTKGSLLYDTIHVKCTE